MILPTKHITQDRALLTIGSHILKRLDKQKTVSALWEETNAKSNARHNANQSISYDWFVLALDLLFAIEAIDINEGLIYKKVSL